MTTIVLLLMGVAALASLTVLVQAARRGAAAWGELQHALAKCPERRTCRIIHMDVVARPAGTPRLPKPLSRPAPLRSPRPALRAAA